MSYSCPKCNDHHTQSVPMAYESGTRTDNRGDESQSVLASRLAPPRKRRSWPRLLVLLVMPAVGVAITHIVGEMFAPILILALLAGIFVWAFGSTARYNSTVWESEMRAWRSLWFCHACGAMFLPQASAESTTITQECTARTA